ncbi:PREDICTED: lipopolysaccharide-induced tumor necrosis factor-alpha factor homolog [Rhagoletis zephyria]|uniref:lipopolysaccharide-induced tumor necrosis factor-alpha factor homolog n=1 Tax=Rhagoletis zephyria TaxID=28612 RepID=UPI00081193BD|nr:PREDICTED: lipopolysaccharide-induced tumor necrosis factor-alpha factor homolog [Rhagoletis zephyria]KAH9390556.1 hypothetical protein TYRP_022971 [Tyrophagus putrescentiae]KAH9409642.1 hypothetical protein TYRP_010652 [Tyrophagus putrescentiae]
MSNSNNMYPSVPSAPTEEGEGMEPTKVYPPLQAVSGEAYAMPPPPAYSEQAPILQNVPQPATQTTIVIADNLPAKSIPMKCYYCNEDITTKIESKTTVVSWLLCSLLCIFGCFCGCCLIPLMCSNGSKDILHYCPKCKKYLGCHERVRFGRFSRN